MSAIPPPGHASLIQTTAAAQRAADQKRAEADAAAVDAQAFADRLKVAVSNDDRDSAVYEDAEGAGGQGRQNPSESHENSAESNDMPEDETADDGGIDISA